MSDTEETSEDAAWRFAKRLMIAQDMLYQAWTVIANAGDGDWDKETADWCRAARQWRDEWHEYLREVEEMSTPIHHLIRNGFSIYFEDMARNRHHLADCASTDVAEEVIQILSKFHGVEYEVEPPVKND